MPEENLKPKEEHKLLDKPDEPLLEEGKKGFNESEGFTPKIGEAGEVKTLLVWESPYRPFRKKDRSFYTTSATIVILIVLILILAKEFLLIGAILAVTFVVYVLAYVPPSNIKFRISTQGVIIGEDFYFWHYLDSFWFKKHEKESVLYIQTRLRFPSQLMLVLGNPSTGSGQVSEEEVKKLVARFLPFHEVPYKSWMEKWSDGLQKHFPLENIHR